MSLNGRRPGSLVFRPETGEAKFFRKGAPPQKKAQNPQKAFVDFVLSNYMQMRVTVSLQSPEPVAPSEPPSPSQNEPPPLASLAPQGREMCLFGQVEWPYVRFDDRSGSEKSEAVVLGGSQFPKSMISPTWKSMLLLLAVTMAVCTSYNFA